MGLLSRYRRLNNLYRIVDKRGNAVKFQLNAGQQKLYEFEQKQIKEEGRIRNIILKARQVGFTTYKCIYNLDKALFYPNQNIYLVAHKLDKVQDIFQKIKYAYDNLPDGIRTKNGIRYKPKAKYDNKNELFFKNNNSKIKVVIDARSGTSTSIHISELAKIQNAKDMMTGTLPTAGDKTDITIESTAYGMGNYFHELRYSSLTNQKFRTFFYPWYEHQEYRLKQNQGQLPDELNHIKHLEQEQINWYHDKYMIYGRDVFQEYPTNPDEAFLSTGNPVVNLEVIKGLDKLDYKEDLKYKDLRIYKEPEEYCYYGVDTAGGGIDGDNSCISVRDKHYNLLAFYYGKSTPDNLANIIDYLYKLGYTGMIGIEANNTGLTTLNEAKNYYWYQNIYYDMSIDKITNKKTKKIGFLTTAKTRPYIINNYEKAIRLGELTELDEREKSELYGFVYNEKNRPEAIEGQHDDAIMADCICLEMVNKHKFI